ncbi:MAG: hypothetical protein MI749_13135 [Desulfovibrionales bacterium]|nr:hypothetical protein [Desulfovibrionales bacterium]
MIYAVSSCSACPFYITEDDGVCTGCFPEKKTVDVDSEATRPEWCPVHGQSLRVTERASNNTGLPAIPVDECSNCPFYYENEKRRCNIANPKGRPILSEGERPVWCILRKEVVVIRG